MVGTPGTYIEGWTEPFPSLNELKRMYVSNPQLLNFKVMSFMLPHKDEIKVQTLPCAGAIVGSYFSPLVPLGTSKQMNDKSKYKAIARKWRTSHSTLHNDTRRLMNEAEIDLTDERDEAGLLS